MKKTVILFIFLSLIAVGCKAALQEESVVNEPATTGLPVEKETQADRPQGDIVMESLGDLNPEKFENLAETVTSAVIKTNKGDITVEFYSEDSPVTVNNFLNLAKKGYYNGTKFHRVIKDFMIQGGDPLSKEADTSRYGTGGPAYRFLDEFNNHPLVLGSLAMANSGPNTNGSQFFIVTADSTPWLDGKHTNFGHVTAGLDVVQKIGITQTNQRDLPLDPIVIESIELK